MGKPWPKFTRSALRGSACGKTLEGCQGQENTVTWCIKTHTASAQDSSTPVPWRWRSRGARIGGLKELEGVIARRAGACKEAAIIATMPGVSHFTATSLACSVGRVERFPRAHSLANYWGLTPGCRNSGENNQRLGSITKAGSAMAR